MKFGELIDQAVECIKSYNPVYKTVDSHADEFLSSVSWQHTFIYQTLTSCEYRLKTPMRKSLLNRCSTDAYVTKNSWKFSQKFFTR
jgi:hypothetical protein